MTIFDVILKLAAIIGAAFIAYILPTIASQLKTSLGEEKAAQLAETIRTLVISAEATMNLATGEEKKAYVEKQLEELGIEVTELVKAQIDTQVYEAINYGEVKKHVVDNTPAVKATKKKSK